MLRKFRHGALLILLCSIIASATDSDVAVIQAMQTAWLNGTPVPRISAIFPGDVVQTKDDWADIDAFGSKVRIWKDSLVTYRSNAVELGRGGISVITSQALAAQIAGVTIRPASASWTEFKVTNSDGAVHIVAAKGDLLVADESSTATLNAGRETTIEVPRHKQKKRGGGAVPAAVKSPLESTPALIGAGAVIGGVAFWTLCQGDDPISPDTPQHNCF